MGEVAKAPAVHTEGKTWAEVTRCDPMVSLVRLDADPSVEGFCVFKATYSRANIVQAYPAPGGGVVYEWRGEGEVFHCDSVASGPGRPVTLMHPRVPGRLLTTSNALGQARGAILTFARVDELHTGGEMSVWDGLALKAIDTRAMRQISLGSRVKIDPRGGTTDHGKRFDRRQTRIRVNHAAIERRGRAGTAEIKLDGASLVTDLKPYLEGPPPASPIIIDFGDFARLDGLTSANEGQTMTEAPSKTEAELQARLDAFEAKFEGVDVDVLLTALSEGREGRLDGLTELGIKLPEAPEPAPDDSKEYAKRIDALEQTNAAMKAANEQTRIDAAGFADALEVARRAFSSDYSPAKAGIKDLDVDALRSAVVTKVMGATAGARLDGAGHEVVEYAFEDAREALAQKANGGHALKAAIALARGDAPRLDAKPDPMHAAAQQREAFGQTANRTP